ncbi:mucin-17 isoform X1 [Melia azedarach]|uniref:Mucin-17 isoform X1 n=1 Tax=Melia azedarach TaxID=155640 RepID=A0ACC1WZ81_MELAZ|nr:mucin-17 isoform X1 [Melia azedarach]
MMNRYNNNMRESLAGGRNIPVSAQLQHRRGQSLTGISKDASDDNQLDLFSKTRRSLSVASSDDSSDVSVKLGRLSIGSAKLAKSGIDDLLSSTDGGKHDYDWLLTPPGTPLFPSSDGIESQPNPVAPRSTYLARSVSTTKASRLSVSQSESNHSSRPARSSSVTRYSMSASQYSTYSSNRSSSILNTSSASVSSYTRPASPSARSVSSARPSTPSARPTASRSSTPSRTRPSLTSASMDKSRPSVPNSRPSTPSSRPQIPANLNSTTIRSSSRPSTPTRRNPITSTSPALGSSISSGRVMSNGRSQGPASRPSSPSPRVRPPQQPVVPPDFPLDTPPNLRTTLPDRPVSAGRSRPGAALTMKSNPETTGSVNMPRRHSSPIVTRGRLTDTPGRVRTHSNGHTADILESRKTSHISEQSMRKPVKSMTSAAESNGFGRTISKKSLDMAIRHMDIRNGSGSIRQLSGTTLFPQSIRSASSKAQSGRAMDSVNMNGTLQNGDLSEKGNSSISRAAENGNEAINGRYSAKLSEVDIYESSRYDAILLKEDLKNTNWLHSIDDKSDQELIFDNGFEPLPEPFGLL